MFSQGCAPKIEGGSSSECESEESDGEGIEAKAIRKANHKLRKGSNIIITSIIVNRLYPLLNFHN